MIARRPVTLQLCVQGLSSNSVIDILLSGSAERISRDGEKILMACVSPADDELHFLLWTAMATDGHDLEEFRMPVAPLLRDVRRSPSEVIARDIPGSELKLRVGL